MIPKMMRQSSDMAKPIGPGEKITQMRQRNKRAYLGASLVLGLLIGGSFALFDRNRGDGGGGGFATMVLDPGIALGLAGLLALGLVGLPLYMFRTIDELAVQHNLRAMSAGWFAMLAGYPIWQALAAGGWTEQPHALGIFVLGYIVTAIAYSIAKWRS